ncbi:MAG TPA: MtnX-like HAD-IB family phosphatase [Planktothrix sp.]|jgi:2,3-diketo-5-methylthio-1-phosphopentane phosphatase
MSNFVEVYCDFDGTITRGDTIDVLLDRLADPAWEQIEQRWVAGEIGSRECMSMQVPLIRGGWEAIREVLDGVQIDPTFPKFAKWCRQNGVSLKVVSDGIDRVIHHILKREGIHVDNVWANHLVEHENGSLELSFPHAPQVAGCGSGLCKCKILANGSSRYIKAIIGDGRSDFCWSADADVVFAKKSLLKHCRETGIKVTPYEDFTSVRAALQELITVPSELMPVKKRGFAQAG